MKSVIIIQNCKFTSLYDNSAHPLELQTPRYTISIHVYEKVFWLFKDFLQLSQLHMHGERRTRRILDAAVHLIIKI
jgi:hypothetical protein